jgi:D-arabinose 1-dehydrogenase-like Zn-dependent alcohol dehydrogenase
MPAETMRSVQVPRPGAPFEVAEREVPEPAAGEVRVRVHACGICRSDAFAVSGLPGAPYPLVPGHEISGAVDAIGPGTVGWEIGTQVGVGWFGGQCGHCPSCYRGDFVMCAQMKAPGLLAQGGYADYLVVPGTALARVPGDLAATDIGPLMCAGVTAFNALRNNGARPGRRVAILGIGGLGHLAVQFAAKMGCEVIAISRGRGKEEAAFELGAHGYVDASRESAAEDLLRRGDVDLIVATAPSGAMVSRFVSCLAPRGRVVVTGFSDDDLRISPALLIGRNITVAGCAAGTSKDAEETLAFSALSGVRPIVEQFPLDEAVEAYARVLDGTVRFRAVLTTADGQQRPAAQLATWHSTRGETVMISGDKDAGVLDCPADAVPDGDELIQAAMRWHFDPRTGSPFWLERAKTFGFDPRRDVRTWSDLGLFPNVMEELREVRAADLIPRGYGEDPPLLGVYESGGTTGIPKKVVLLRDWRERWLAWAMRVATDRGFPRNANWLLLTPSGPHVFGYLAAFHAQHLGGTPFMVDMDPRWVRRLLNEGRRAEADSYAEHLVAQAAHILRTQEIGLVVATPSLLERIARDEELVALMRKSVRLINWGGMHMDADTRRLYRTEIFPGIELCGLYGNTMVIGGSAERVGSGDECVFDPHAPYVSFAVVDPATGQPVPYGVRGRVVTHHVSKSAFLPNNLDRDIATRVPPLPGQLGDSVADVAPAPAATADEDTFGQGVY